MNEQGACSGGYFFFNTDLMVDTQEWKQKPLPYPQTYALVHAELLPAGETASWDYNSLCKNLLDHYFILISYLLLPASAYKLGQ